MAPTPLQKARQPSPTIFITQTDFDLLDRLSERQRSEAAELLRQELDRAIVIDEREDAPPFVRLDAWVEFLDLPTGRTRIVRVVRPEDADIDRGFLSVMTQVGAALLGLSPGDSFSFNKRNGGERVLVVMHVEGP